MITETFANKAFDKFISIIFAVILVFIIIGIAIGAFQLFNSIWVLLRFQGITGEYINFIADVLTLYVLVELSRSLVEYFNSHKLRLRFIADAAIVFIIREVLIGLFKHDLKADLIYALAALLLVLGALRVASILLHQREKLLDSGS